jgi:RNA recognition motif-containing protein
MSEPSTSYLVLPISLHSKSKLVRHLYLKPQSGQGNLPQGRAVFVAGLPAELHEGALLELFSKFGEVERAAVHGSRLSAVVLYSSKQGRDAALKAATKGKTIRVDVTSSSSLGSSIGVNSSTQGLKAWVNAHKAQKPGNAELQRQLDKWMEDYEAEEERRKASAMASMEEDGWTVVQRHKGRKKNTSESGVTVGAVAAAAAAARAAKKRPIEHADFYRFQQREKRRNDLLELRERFEEDKRRLVELKAVRKFKSVG